MDESRVLVCVTGQKTCERLIREGSRLAIERNAELSVLHIAKKGAELLGSFPEAQALEYLFTVSKEFGADMTVIRSDDVVGTIAAQSEKMGVGLIVLGAPREGCRDLTIDIKLRLPQMEFQIVYTD